MEDKGKYAATAPLQDNYHICFNRLCVPPSQRVPNLVRRPTPRGEQQRPLPPPDAASPVAALIVSRPPTVSPRPGALPSRGGRRLQFGSLERVAKKRSESAQLISAVKTDTGGALLDCTHFCLLQQIQGFISDKRWSRFWGCLGDHITQWLDCPGRGDRMAYYGASWAFLWRKPGLFFSFSD